jgi:hypothetical protein
MTGPWFCSLLFSNQPTSLEVRPRRLKLFFSHLWISTFSSQPQLQRKFNLKISANPNLEQYRHIEEENCQLVQFYNLLACQYTPKLLHNRHYLIRILPGTYEYVETKLSSYMSWHNQSLSQQGPGVSNNLIIQELQVFTLRSFSAQEAWGKIPKQRSWEFGEIQGLMDLDFGSEQWKCSKLNYGASFVPLCEHTKNHWMGELYGLYLIKPVTKVPRQPSSQSPYYKMGWYLTMLVWRPRTMYPAPHIVTKVCYYQSSCHNTDNGSEIVPITYINLTPSSALFLF